MNIQCQKIYWQMLSLSDVALGFLACFLEYKHHPKYFPPRRDLTVEKDLPPSLLSSGILYGFTCQDHGDHLQLVC